MLAVILVVLLLALVVFVLGGPIRAARERAAQAGPPGAAHDQAAADAGGAQSAEVDELETAREAKYREIRDAELDYRTGKLSRDDYEAVDADLRAEAIEILDRLERLQAEPPGDGEPAASDAEAGEARRGSTDAEGEGVSPRDA